MAGDVSEELEQLEAALRLLRSKFSRVWFTCGNHDLWLTPNDARSGCRTSMTKCEEIMDICEALGVETGPGRFGEAEEGRARPPEPRPRPAEPRARPAEPRPRPAEPRARPAEPPAAPRAPKRRRFEAVPANAVVIDIGDSDDDAPPPPNRPPVIDLT